MTRSCAWIRRITRIMELEAMTTKHRMAITAYGLVFPCTCWRCKVQSDKYELARQMALS